MAKSPAQLDREIAEVIQSPIELTIDDRNLPWRELQIRAQMGEREVGSLDIQTDEAGIPFVSMVSVSSDVARRGVATRLYQEAVRIANERYGRELHSDVERSGPTDMFWQKEVRKGNAVCVGKVRTAAKSVPFDHIVKGRSGCARYRMTKKP